MQVYMENQDQEKKTGNMQQLEKEMVLHFSILAGKIPWTEQPGTLQSIDHKDLDTTEEKQRKQCQTLFWGAPKSLQMVTAAMKLKDAYSLEGK